MKTKLLGIGFVVFSAMLVSAPAGASPVCTQGLCYMDTYDASNAMSFDFFQQATTFDGYQFGIAGSFVVDNGLLLSASAVGFIPLDTFVYDEFMDGSFYCVQFTESSCAPSQTSYFYGFSRRRDLIVGESYDPLTETYFVGFGSGGSQGSIGITFTTFPYGRFLGGSAHEDVCPPSYPCYGSFGLGPQTPLPAALPLFASGLGVMALLGWRRKRKSAA
jgi:hypothetical protein